MTHQEAVNNIGQPFKLEFITGHGAAGEFDIIQSVDADGIIHGNFIEAPCQDCRLKGEQPEHLKKTNHHDTTSPTLFPDDHFDADTYSGSADTGSQATRS